MTSLCGDRPSTAVQYNSGGIIEAEVLNHLRPMYDNPDVIAIAFDVTSHDKREKLSDI